MAHSVAASPLRRALLAGAAVAALGTGALAAQDANAAFTLTRCNGASNVNGVGASFQNALHAQYKIFFQGVDGCGGVGTSPTMGRWQPDGSGAGKRALGSVDGVRDPGYSFGGADEAPTGAELARINAGPTGATSDDGQIRVIPIATGAATLIVHLPEGCSIAGVSNKTNGRTGALGDVDTTDSATDFTQRLRFTGEQIEAAFSGTAATWGDIAPGISGDPTGISGGDQRNAALNDCGAVPIRRIVRPDISGTTYGWKGYLDLIRPSRRWTTTYGAVNTTWPRAGSGDGSATIARVATGADCDTAGDRICAANASGGGSLARLVASTDGSLGYVDLAGARSNGFSIGRGTSEADKDYTYWSPLQVVAGAGRGLYAEPSYHASAHFNNAVEGIKGANCDTAPITGAPDPAATGGDPTFGDWSAASASGGNGYPACVLTYAMAWDDSAPAYGVSAAQEGNARTVKDYLGLIVSSVGQSRLLRADYSPVPPSLIDYSKNAVNAIDWNKRSGGGQVDPPRVDPPRVIPPRVDTPRVNPPAPPSNQFSIPSRRVSATQLAFTVELPGAGALQVAATTRVGRRTLRVASATASARGAGRVTVRLKLSSAAKKALARARGKKLTVAVKFTFTPTGGTARTVTQTVTVRAARRAARRPARRGGRGRKQPAKR